MSEIWRPSSPPAAFTSAATACIALSMRGPSKPPAPVSGVSTPSCSGALCARDDGRRGEAPACERRAPCSARRREIVLRGHVSVSSMQWFTPRKSRLMSRVGGKLARPDRCGCCGRRPADRRDARSASASLAFCSTSAIARPSRLMATMLSNSASAATGERPADGSSSSSTLGSTISAIAMARICRSPPESVRAACWRLRASIGNRSITLADPRRRAAPGRHSRPSRGSRAPTWWGRCCAPAAHRRRRAA